MVADSTTPLMKLPFTPDGLTERTCSTNALMFSTNFCSSKLILPTPAWICPVLSDRYSTLPALNSRTAAARSPFAGTTVPAFGVGISPRGPSTLPSRDTMPIMSCAASATSNSRKFCFWMRSTRSAPPTTSAPAAFAFSTLSPCANTATRTLLPMPWGSGIAPRTIWSDWVGSMPRLMWISTVSSNFARFSFFSSATACLTLIGPASWSLLTTFFM